MFLKISQNSQRAPVPGSLFNKVAGLRSQTCNFIKKETLAQVFSSEFCEISKNIFFVKHLWWLLLKSAIALFFQRIFFQITLSSPQVCFHLQKYQIAKYQSLLKCKILYLDEVWVIYHKRVKETTLLLFAVRKRLDIYIYKQEGIA